MIFAGLMGVVVVAGLIGVTWLALATEPRHRRLIRSPVARRVAEGAARLDAAVPDWWERVDMNQLCISCSHQCILAQVFGGYIEGLDALRLLGGESFDCGFCGEDEHDEIILRREWLDLIGSRKVERHVKEQYV